MTRVDDEQHSISGLLYTADALEGITQRGSNLMDGNAP